MDSKGIGIRQFRDGLTRYLARVRRGERLVITDRGTPVAALAPHRRADATTRSARVAAMLSSGHVRARRERLTVVNPERVRAR